MVTQTKDLRMTVLIKIIMDSIRSNMKQYTMLAALLSIWIIFSFTTDGIFLKPRNLSNLFLQTSTIAILAIGMTLIIVTGHINLGVGSVAGFLGAVAAIVQVKYGLNTPLTILVTLCCGVVIGALEGYWVAFQKVPAFIVTLASMLAFRGATIGITEGKTIGPMHDSFKMISQDYIPKIFPDVAIHDTSLIIIVCAILLFIIFDFRKRQSRMRYGFSIIPIELQILKVLLLSVTIGLIGFVLVTYRGIPYSVLLVLGLVVLFNFIAENTIFGRHLYAIGGNKDAAKLSGINIELKTFFVFILMGCITATAGMVFLARQGSADTSAGNLFELDAIAASVIGGTSLAGGQGTVPGAIIGALVMESLNNGMSLMNLDITFQYIIKGLILLLAVWVDFLTRKKES
ncbi:MAG: sugar ABC transporter permease [Chitinivibrionales bacterium]|nr:sugar ABC transporter permease [Chitinivibrionales bacterium]